jgi:hypothetical protein
LSYSSPALPSDAPQEAETDDTEVPPPTHLKLERGFINFKTGKRSTSPMDSEASHCYLLAKDCTLTAFPAPLGVWFIVSSDIAPRGSKQAKAKAEAEAFKSFVVASVITAGLPCRFEMTSNALEVTRSSYLVIFFFSN